MGLRNLNFLGDDDDTEIKITESKIEALHQDLTKLRDQLVGESYPVETRNALQEQYGELLHAGHQLVNGAPFQWVPPKDDPSAEEMGKSIDSLSSAINRDNVDEYPDVDVVESVRSSIATLATTLEQAQEFSFAFKEEDVQKKHGRWVQSIGIRNDVDPEEMEEDPSEIYAGPRARAQLQQTPRKALAAGEEQSTPLFLGTGVRGGKDATIPKDTLYRHTATLGITGYGKSTLLTNNMKQLIETGRGLCFIDPKGDDSQKLMEKIPEDRRDDVIWIEPGGSWGKVSGFNFINVGLDPDDPNIETAVSALVSDLKAMLGAGDYWGPRMDRIAGNIIRAMNTYNRRFPEQPDLNLADFYYVLQDPKSRIEFSILVKAAGIDFIEDYTEKIAEMEDDKLEPILGRLQPWIESPIARRMICFRDSEINIPQAVEEGKIIIVRMGDQPDDLKKMLGMAVVRRIWATIRARTSEAEHERDPFYLFVDEAHHVALADDTFPKMLAAARSYRLSINLATQYLSQLPENVVRAMLVNCDTHMSFNPGSHEEARNIAPQLDLEPQTLLNEGRFHIWMRMTDQATGELTDPFKIYIHPPFPPLRERDGAEEIIEESLDFNGREKITPEERKARLQFYKGGGEMEIGVGAKIYQALQDSEIPPSYVEDLKREAVEKRRQALEGIDTEPDVPPADPAAEDEGGIAAAVEEDDDGISRKERIVLESIYGARVKAGVPPGGKTSVSLVEDEIENRLGENYGSGVADTVESLSNFVEMGTREGKETLQLTPEGRAEVFGSTGENPTGGFYAHRRVLRQSFEIFTRLGYHVSLPDQTGEEKSDGIAKSPFDPTAIDAENKSATDLQEALTERMETLEAEYPHVAEISEGRTARIETETTTQFKPAQMLTNLRKSMDEGDFTAFVTKDAYFSEDSRVPDDVDDPTAWWGRYIERAIYDREWDPESGEDKPLYGDENIILAKERTDDGARILYNDKHEFTVGSDDHKALRPATDGGGRTTWKETANGRIIGEDAENGVFAEFESAEAAGSGDPSSVPAYYFYNQSEGEYIVRDGDGERTYGSREELEDQWETFRAPFLAMAEYDETPTADDFAIIVVPNPDNPHHDQPLLYEHGETTPLYDALEMDVPEHALLVEDAEPEMGDTGGQPEADDSAGGESETGPATAEQVEEPHEGAAGKGGDESGQEADESDEEPPGPTPSGPDYAFPEARSLEELPEQCPDCGADELARIEGQPFTGPATALDNFPSACAALTVGDELDMSSQPPMVTDQIETTIVACSECPLVATVYLPDDSHEGDVEHERAESDEETLSAPSQQHRPDHGAEPPQAEASHAARDSDAESGEGGGGASEPRAPVPDHRTETDDGPAVDESETDDGEMPSVDVDDEEEEEFFDSIGSWDHTDEE